MRAKNLLGRLWNGQIRGSGIAAAGFLAVTAAAWIWIKWAGLAVPETMTAFLVWIYTLMVTVVFAALLAGVAVRILFLRLTRFRAGGRTAAVGRSRPGTV